MQPYASKHWLKTCLFISVCSIIVAACQPEKIKPSANAQVYYPLKPGSYLIYNVDSVTYFSSTVVKPHIGIYQIKDSVQTPFTDQTGHTAYVISEYRRDKTTGPWKFVRLFTRSVSATDAEETNGNNRFVKMVFPINLNEDWNANLYNSLDSTHAAGSRYVSVNQYYAAANLQYDSTVAIQMQNDSSLINKYIQNERYAAHIGLVSARHDSVFYSTNGAGGDTTIIGYKFQQTLTDYGPR